MAFHNHQSVTEMRLRQDIKKSLAAVQTILSNTRNPCLASTDQSHTYDDKFSLSISLTNIAMMAVCNALMELGLGLGLGGKDHNGNHDGDGSTCTPFQKLIGVAKEKKLSATLRFETSETCRFVKQSTVSLESPELVHEGGNFIKSLKSKVVTKVPQYHWKVEIRYKIYVYGGNDTIGKGEDSFTLREEVISCDLITRGGGKEQSPFRPSTSSGRTPKEVSLTWLLKQMTTESELNAGFDIDRSANSCRTPKNNAETIEAQMNLRKILNWCHDVSSYFIETQRKIKLVKSQNAGNDAPPDQDMDLEAIGCDEIFNPVLPLFETQSSSKEEENHNDDDDDGGQSKPPPIVLPAADVSIFLAEQCRTMIHQIEALKKNQQDVSGKSKSSSTKTDHIMTSNEAIIILLCKHLKCIVDIWNKSVDYIEHMLLTQLEDAIGKTVQSSDLDEFVRFHNKRIFHEDYAPEPFAYDVRRPGFYPEGMLTIENTGYGYNNNINRMDNDDGKEGHHQAMTFTRKLETSQNTNPFFIPINAAASVELRGDMYLHAWVLSKFKQRSNFQLAARARQFSSFMLVIGKMAGQDTFEPSHAIILQNKDEIMIPLLMEDLPSAKEFKDAIESLSPEQRRFAQAFRSMKLASSVFGVCIIQLKPQLEMLLGLPEKSLTKEIRLTQELLSLFIDYQIPSDLLTFDGEQSLDASSKIEVVKGHVKSVMDMIENAKKVQLKEEEMKANMAHEVYAQMAPSFGCEEEEDHSDMMMMGASFSASPMKRKMRSARKAAAMPQMTKNAFAAPACAFGVNQSAMIQQAPPPRMLEGVFLDDVDQDAPKGETPDRRSNMIRSNIEVSDTVNETKLHSLDCTKIPQELDARFEKFGSDEVYGGVMRTTTLKAGDQWRKSSQLNLLSPMKSNSFGNDEQKHAKNKAFDLLDALSRSGSLPIACAELHIIVASTHSFEKSVVDTVIRDNVNPIEKIERSHVLVASLIHDVGLENLICSKDEVQRILGHSPLLIE